jgi:hypothetical protein
MESWPTLFLLKEHEMIDVIENPDGSIDLPDGPHVGPVVPTPDTAYAPDQLKIKQAGDEINQMTQAIYAAIGKPPMPPDLMSIPVTSGVTVDPKTGFQTGGDTTYAADPNAASLTSNYQAACTLYQAQFTLLWNKLLAEKSSGKPS